MKNNIIKTSKTYLEFSNWIDAHEFDEDGRPLKLNGKPFCGSLLSGYPSIHIKSNDGKDKIVLAHRFVALLFLECPDANAVVNHKNGIKTDFRVSNLEWVSSSENQNHAYKNKLKVAKTKQILMKDINTNEIHEFQSVIDASKFLGIYPQYMSKIINAGKPYKGYLVSYKTDVKTVDEEYFNNNKEINLIIEHPLYKGYFADINTCSILSTFSKEIRVLAQYKNYKNGYWMCALKDKNVMVHRFIMECVSNRLLNKTEHIDHIDGNKNNNSIENLQILNYVENISKTTGKPVGIKFNDGSYMEFKTQHECANHFNVKPSRIYGWIYKNKGYLKYNIKNIFYLNKWGSNEAFLQKQKDEAFDPENPFGDLWQG